MKIMVVDDESIICNGVARFLLRRWPDLKVITYNDPQEAVQAFAQERPQLLITDIRMPGMTGLELIEKVRGLGAENYAVLTGYDEFEYAHQALKLQTQDYLLKPLDKEQLYALVERVMQKPKDEAAVRRQEQITSLRLIIQYNVLINDLLHPMTGDDIFAGEKGCAVIVSHDREWLKSFPRNLYARSYELGRDHNDYCLDLMVVPEQEMEGFSDAAAAYFREQKITAFQPARAALENLHAAYSALMNRTEAALRKAINAWQMKDWTELACILDEMTKNQPLQESLSKIGGFCDAIQIHQESWKLVGLMKALCEAGEGAAYDCWLKWLNALAGMPVPASKGILAAKDVISQHYQEEISLSYVAQQVYIAPSYLSALFHREMGVTFVEYINLVRIDKACYMMLGNEEKSFNEIAEAVGYQTPHYFFKMFRRITDMTPSAFRMMVKEMA